MKKILVLTAVIFCLAEAGAQKVDLKRPKFLGISFIMNDFQTADRIRKSSLSEVIRNDQRTDFGDMTAGLAINYYNGFTNNIDVAVSVAGSFPRISLKDKTTFSEKFLLEADASANINLLTPRYFMTPYASVGIGASSYDGEFSALIPVGAGLRFRLSEESAVYMSGQYRIPLMLEANNYHFQFGLGFASAIGK